MSLLLRILLIPCLAPLMAVLVLSMMHRGDSTRLQVLAWESPQLPLGAWTAMGAGGGAAVGAGFALLLRPSRLQLSRTFRQQSRPGSSEDSDRQTPHPFRGPIPAPERDLRDPAPTVAVPFRVIQRPTGNTTERTRKPEGGTAVESSPGHGDWGDDPARNW